MEEELKQKGVEQGWLVDETIVPVVQTIPKDWITVDPNTMNVSIEITNTVGHEVTLTLSDGVKEQCEPYQCVSILDRGERQTFHCNTREGARALFQGMCDVSDYEN